MADKRNYIFFLNFSSYLTVQNNDYYIKTFDISLLSQSVFGLKSNKYYFEATTLTTWT